ncbi:MULTISPECIES: DNA-processing protein DprA [unclassified Streptomyces]|uniref:DNA-processing protein DprA n=1 Tax=unclassified Streptomyces TaxID=2593676 RepID=UPI000DBAD701|nr:DNA-processing protein DprA [Streptomyces sp. PsTaAH-137]MYT71185.1 hypothetical protein [Streptomyces sp. SID8367]RAJ69594.1 DNA processing protein [Streptomyces sp. PsTaAH-137]
MPTTPAAPATRQRAARAALSAYLTPEEIPAAQSPDFDPVTAWQAYTYRDHTRQLPHRPETVLDRGELTARFVTPADSQWPAALTDLGPACPLGLWVRGDLTHAATGNTVAIVGNRAASQHAVTEAALLAYDVAAQGHTVSSTLALGVETAAQDAVMPARTIAVIPRGLDRCHPHSNDRIMRRAADHGCVISLHTAHTPTTITSLRRAAWLTVALARTVVLVEAIERSPAMEYARAARAMNRPLYIPQQLADDPRSTGSRRLLAEGHARPCPRASELLSDAV